MLHVTDMKEFMKGRGNILCVIKKLETNRLRSLKVGEKMEQDSLFVMLDHKSHVFV